MSNGIEGEKGVALTETSSSNANILDVIPPELQLEIVRHLTLTRDIANASRVCGQFYELLQDPLNWKQLTKEKWEIKEFGQATQSDSFDWKVYFREKVAMEKKLDCKFVQSKTVPPPRQSHGAARVGSKLVIMGGHTLCGDSFERKNDIWVLDTQTGEFQEVISPNGPPPALSRHRMVTVDNLVYSFGGITQDKRKLDSILTFDLASNELKELKVHGTPPQPRCDPVFVGHGKEVIVFGGSVKDLIFPSDVHVFNTETLNWRQPETNGPAPSQRIGSVGIVLHNKLYLYGGGAYDKELKKYTTLYTEMWTLDLNTWTWQLEQAKGDIPSVSEFLNIFSVGNHIVIEGGWCTPPFSYDTISRTWQKLQHVSSVNNSDTSCTVVDNAAYYYGGFFNTYTHHLVKMDLSHLSFLTAKA